MGRIRSLLLISVLMWVAIGAQSASASPVDLVCPFAATATFTPGVTLTPRPVTIGGSTAVGSAALPIPCSSVLSGTPFTGGTGQVSASGTLACVIVGDGLSGTITGTILHTWNTGETSTISFSIISAGPVPVFVASITAGALQGSSVTVIPGLTGLTGNCLLSPTTSLSFAGLLIVSRL